ncbi:MAG: response regulator transcription factor [Bacteroidia bacterium]|nr:response regulator transcription factor [Bacteroidia bacterium]
MAHKAIIIDDELRARKLLSGILGEYAKNILVAEECGDLPSGVKAIRKHKPDVVFLDIEMPGHSGLELLDFFNEDEINFEIIFTTAYNQYAIQAFKLSAIDYLLKPIDTDELQNAIARFEKKKNTAAPNFSALKENLKNKDTNKIAVPTGNSFRFISLSDILYLKADSSYTEIYFIDGTKLIVSRTLKNFEEALDTSVAFFRCHKSYLVNPVYITEYIKSDGGYILLNGKTTIPISSEKVDELLETMKKVSR